MRPTRDEGTVVMTAPGHDLGRPSSLAAASRAAPKHRAWIPGGSAASRRKRQRRRGGWRRRRRARGRRTARCHRRRPRRWCPRSHRQASQTPLSEEPRAARTPGAASAAGEAARERWRVQPAALLPSLSLGLEAGRRWQSAQPSLPTGPPSSSSGALALPPARPPPPSCLRPPRVRSSSRRPTAPPLAARVFVGSPPRKAFRAGDPPCVRPSTPLTRRCSPAAAVAAAVAAADDDDLLVHLHGSRCHCPRQGAIPVVVPR